MSGQRLDWWRAVLCGLALLSQALGGSARADDEETARSYLTSLGLVASGRLWLTPQEVQLRKRLEGLEQLEKRFRQATQNEKGMLQRNESIRAQLIQVEAAAKGKSPPKSPPPPTASSSAKGSPSDAKAKPAESKLNSKMIDVTGLGDETPLQLATIELVNARNALLLAVLEIRRASGELETEYAPLRSDQRVAASLLALGSKWRLGPAKDYQREQPRLASAAQSVLTTRVPMYYESGHARISVIVGEERPATFALAENSEPTVITASLAQAAGIMADPAVAAVPYKVGERAVSTRPATIGSLRIGKQLLSQVAVLVLPPEAEDLGCSLGAKALGGYKLQLEPRSMAAVLEARGNR